MVMGRYCIVCQTLFGCVKGDIKYVCEDCADADHCPVLADANKEQVTGGICQNCWAERLNRNRVINF